jgi:hypothetical protein
MDRSFWPDDEERPHGPFFPGKYDKGAIPMIHRLKALLLAAMAVMAVSAVAASAAQAVPLFHSDESSTTVTARQDGTGKTAHQVFDAGVGQTITCETLSGEASVTESTVTTIQVGNIAYGGCSFLGTISGVFVNMHGCEYTLTSDGGPATAGGATSGQVTIDCPAGNEIEFGISGVCIVKVPPQGPKNEIMYHNIGSTATNTTEVTVEPNVTGITRTATGVGCTSPGTASDGEYTTGNAIATGEQPGTQTMVPVWWE